MLLPLYELYEAVDEGGSIAESVLILLHLFERGLMLGSVSVVVSTLENGNGSEFKPYSCIYQVIGVIRPREGEREHTEKRCRFSI